MFIQLHAMVPGTGVAKQHRNLLLWASLFILDIFLREMRRVYRRFYLFALLNSPPFRVFGVRDALSLICRLTTWLNGQSLNQWGVGV